MLGSARSANDVCDAFQYTWHEQYDSDPEIWCRAMVGNMVPHQERSAVATVASILVKACGRALDRIHRRAEDALGRNMA